MDQFELFELLRAAAPAMLRGAGSTLLFAGASMLGGLALGFLLAVARILPYRSLQWSAAAYVSVLRGTPLLVQVFVIYYGLPSAGIELSATTAGILALSLNAAAYLSESMRGALAGVGHGQWAAAYSLGLSYRQALHHIIVPQAMRMAVPAMSNTLISLIKDTSLVSVITVTELMLATKEVIATTFRPLPLYLAAAAVYWVLSLCFEALQHRLEQGLARAYRQPETPRAGKSPSLRRQAALIHPNAS